MTRDFKGIWIPRDLWFDKNLTVMEKLFFVEIDSLDNEDGCYASNAHFSNHFELSKSRCTEVIKSLEKKGFVSIELERNKKLITKRIIKVRGIRKTEQGYSENRTGVFGKPKESNTSINNTIDNRKAQFKKLLSPFLKHYKKEMLKEFYEYWTEHGVNDKKLRFEKEKSFGVTRRLSTWASNQKKFNPQPEAHLRPVYRKTVTA